VLVSVDLTEINHKPMPARTTADNHPIITSLKVRIETMQAELAKVENLAAGHRADFERERERFDRLMVEMLKATVDAQIAKEALARLDGELRALKSRRWWPWVARRKKAANADHLSLAADTPAQSAGFDQIAAVAA
jgi:glutamine synthetase adenylyltransferase